VAIELSDGQRVALNLVYEPFRDGGDWPQQRYLEKSLRRHGLSLDSVFEGMPPGLMAPDPAYTHFYVRPDEPIALTIAGMSACTGSQGDIDLFLRALQFFVALEDAYSPPPTGGGPLNAGTTELVNDLGLTEDEAERVYQLTRHEIGMLGSGGGHPDNWQFELTPDIQRFAGVSTIDDYLEERIVPQAYRKAAFDLGALTSPSPFSLQSALAPEPLDGPETPSAPESQPTRWHRLTLLNRALAHPLISGILAAVIAGIILAAIYGH
jgi:hypothetical protein